MQNRLFFPQIALDYWISEGAAELAQTELTLLSESQRYQIAEALHVTQEVTGGVDPHDLVGRVKSREYLAELGAEVLETSMILGDNAYEVVPGFCGIPVVAQENSATDEVATSSPPSQTGSDEDLLTKFLMQNL